MAVYVSHEDVGYGAHVLVPMLVVEVVRHESRGKWQVLLLWLHAWVGIHLPDQYHLGLVRREAEPFYVSRLRHLPSVRAISLHAPHVAFEDEGYALASVYECRLGLALVAFAQNLPSRPVNGNCQDGRNVAVGCNVGRGYGVGHGAAIGRHGIRAYSVHAPERLRSHQVVCFHFVGV